MISPRVGLAKISKTIPAGETKDITSGMLRGFIITGLTDGASAEFRVGNAETLPLFKGLKVKLPESLLGLRISNTGGTSLTVTGFYWENADVDDLRLVLDAATSVLAVKPRVDAGTSLTTIRQDPYSYAGSATTTEIISAAQNVSGVRLCAGLTMMADPAIPGSFGQLRFDATNPVYIGAVAAGGLFVLPQSVDIPAGKNVAIRWLGGVGWCGGFTLL